MKNMEIRNVTVRLGGSLLNTVNLDDVTPAEAALIRLVQRSSQAVIFRKDEKTNRVITRKVERSKKQELRRLLGKYKKRHVLTIFPGVAVNSSIIPELFDDIDMEGGLPDMEDHELTIAGDDLPEPGSGEKPE